MKKIIFIVVTVLLALLVFKHYSKSPEKTIPGSETTSVALISKAPEGAAVFILEPGDGTTVSSPVSVRFGIANMKVAPAGDNQDNSGHHHLLINMDELPDMTKPLPASEKLIHFGKGQTETTIDLPAGEHSLQLLLGNYLHIPHKEPVISKKITITVID